MKQLAIVAYPSEGHIIIVSLSDELISVLKNGVELCREVKSKTKFPEGIIYKIPFSRDEISLYSLHTVLKIRIKKGTESVNPTGIEYLALPETERWEYCDENNLDANYALVRGGDLHYVTRIDTGGYIIIKDESINFEASYNFLHTKLSETIEFSTIEKIIS